MRVSLHAIHPRSRANGPGVRMVLWFQGCDLGCPGCFNPQTHSFGGPSELVDDVIATIVDAAGEIDGITLSGGEPLQQPAAAIAIAKGVRERTSLSVVVFSGYSHREIADHPERRELLDYIDVLIDGRFVERQRMGQRLRGSRNQQAHRLTERYSHADIEATPTAEVQISPDGEIVLTGVDPLSLD